MILVIFQLRAMVSCMRKNSLWVPKSLDKWEKRRNFQIMWLTLILAQNRYICLRNLLLFLVTKSISLFQSSVARWLCINSTSITLQMLSIILRLRWISLSILMTVWTIAWSHRPRVLQHQLLILMMSLLSHHTCVTSIFTKSVLMRIIWRRNTVARLIALAIMVNLVWILWRSFSRCWALRM